ncbi:MAG: filamentous hemagglutinin N-terminal domain-containing protein [Caulobacteraceae bacterium]|nr:MAG: filamentous hemagglutinin N-terminal domain-containing protein [Caulobacteraceae bacterium]
MAVRARHAAPHTFQDASMTRHDPKFSSLPPMRANRRRILVASTFLAGLVTALSLGTTATAQTLPTGGTVVGGAATVVTTGNTMTVNQSTRNVILNWNSFSIGSGSTVNFVQPDASSVALNRVLGADPSVIMGNLNSNGQVFLINPNGILFGLIRKT